MQCILVLCTAAVHLFQISLPSTCLQENIDEAICVTIFVLPRGASQAKVCFVQLLAIIEELSYLLHHPLLDKDLDAAVA